MTLDLSFQLRSGRPFTEPRMPLVKSVQLKDISVRTMPWWRRWAPIADLPEIVHSFQCSLYGRSAFVEAMDTARNVECNPVRKVTSYAVGIVDDKRKPFRAIGRVTPYQRR